MNRRLALPLIGLIAGVGFPVPAGATLRQVVVGNFYFEDETDDGRLEAQAGDQLRFTLLDNGPGTPHTVEVDALGIHSGSLTVGETFTTPPLNQPGTYVLYCKPHLQRGHKTTLVVSGTATTAAPTTTTTQAPATVTTQPTTTTKPPTTSTTAARAVTGGTAASTTTTARPTTTTGKATSPTTVTGGTAPAGTTPSTGSPAATTDPTGGLTEGETAVGASVGGRSDGGLVAAGRGKTDEALGGAGGASLDAIIGRLPQRQGPWTRSVRLAFAALLPMALAAALTLFRWTRLAAAAGNTRPGNSL